MIIQTKSEVCEGVVAALGPDAGACGLLSIEALTAAVRRVAGFLCPCPQYVLVQAVVEPFQELTDDVDKLLDDVEQSVEALLAYGDLIEQREVAPDRIRQRTLLYAAPPSFVWRDSGVAILLGVSPDHALALPAKLRDRVEYDGHLRRVSQRGGEGLREELQQYGLIELSTEEWQKDAPRQESSAEYVGRMGRMMMQNWGTIEGLKIINPETPVNFYRGRWEEVHRQSGRFVARRPQPYGNDLWCYVELQDGMAVKLLDLPAVASSQRGCDEAWRLQMAIDAVRGRAQQYRVRDHSGFGVVELFSPLPMWALRRWDLVGEPAVASHALFAYRFPDQEVKQETEFLENELWLTPA
jgi:hypothetical protein